MKQLFVLLAAALLVAGCMAHPCYPRGADVSWQEEGVKDYLLTLDAELGPFIDIRIPERGIPLNGTMMDQRVGEGVRLTSLHNETIAGLFILWGHEEGPMLQTPISVRPPGLLGADQVAAAAAELVATVAVDPAQARDWVDSVIWTIMAEGQQMVPIPVPLDPKMALGQETDGRLDVRTTGFLALQGEERTWRFEAPYWQVWMPEVGTVTVYGSDRVVVGITENPRDLDHALAIAATVLQDGFGFQVTSQEDPTLQERIVCA